MHKLIIVTLTFTFWSCAVNAPQESGTLEVVSITPAEGSQIDCNSTIQFKLKYQITNAHTGGSRTIAAQNNQTSGKSYGLNALEGEVSDQISGQDFYSNIIVAKCRLGKLPFSFQFSLNLANGNRIDSKTYYFNEVPGTSCLANTGWC